MPLSRTNITTATKGQSTATSITTASFTPANNSVLVVFGCLQSSNTSLNPTISGGSLTWTRQAIAGPSTDGFGHFTVVWTALVATGAAMTVTVGGLPSDGTSEGIVYVFSYTGYNTIAPVGGVASGAETGASTAFTIALNQTPALTSEVIAAASDDTSSGVQNIAVGSGYTQQLASSDGVNVSSLSETRTNSTSTSVIFDTQTLTGGNAVAVGIEIQQAAAGAPIDSSRLLLGVGV